MKPRTKRILLGLGLDNQDGHKRITRGKNFELLGGSQDTHEHMTETAIKFNEKLKERSKTIEGISRDEFIEIMDDVS